MRKHIVAVGAILLLVHDAVKAQEPITLKGHGGWVGAVAFAPDHRRLAIGASDGSVCIWDAVDGKKLATLPKHDDAVSGLSFSPDGKLLISGGYDGMAHAHDMDGDLKKPTFSYRMPRYAGAILSVAANPGPGKRFFLGSMEGVIHEAAIEVPQSRRMLKVHTSWVNGLAIDRQGTLLASASSDNSLRVRDVKTLDERCTFRVKEGEIRSVAFSPDGKLLAAGIRYGAVRVWNLEDKSEVATLKAHEGETWAVAFTPDGKTLASGGGDWNKPSDVRLWNVGTWKERAKLPHTGEVLCLSISGDGSHLAAGSWDRTVRVWALKPAK